MSVVEETVWAPGIAHELPSSCSAAGNTAPFFAISSCAMENMKPPPTRFHTLHTRDMIHDVIHAKYPCESIAPAAYGVRPL